ncbi:MAG TPA: hypothetical protein DD435_12655 [Cyanobacteria bacterium UBA8530]|nr:hypothetical protein [Cyanobacteria bacterium UBA8530]
MDEAYSLAKWLEDLISPLSAVRENAAMRLNNAGASAVPVLIDAIRLSSTSFSLCRQAAEVLGSIGKEAVHPLLEVLFEESLSARSSATFALERIGEEAVEALIEALEIPCPMVRNHAAMALGKIGDPRAISPLIRRLSDEPEVADSAVFALGQIGQPALEAVSLTAEHPEPSVRLRAVLALGKIGNFHAMPILSRLLGEEKNPEVMKAARCALEGILMQPPTLDTDP